MLRGIISPPRSRSSPRESRPYNNNPITNPPSKPNYKSPCRRPTAPVNPTAHRSHRKETTQSTAVVKPTAIRPTKINSDRSSNTSRTDPSKSSTSKTVSSRRQIAAPNANEKKLENNNFNPKTANKIGTRSSSPRLTKPISQPTRGATPSKSNVKGAIGFGSRSDISASGAKPSGTASQKYFDSQNGSPKHLPSGGLGHQQDLKVGNVGNQKRYSGGHCAALGDPDVRDQLQQLSIDGKDLANIVLHANLIYESFGSDTKEEECSSQSNNAPRIFQIYKEIASHRQGNSTITSYVTKLKALWDELATYSDLPQCSCGSIEKLSELIEREKVMQFLVGLDDSYCTICAQILLMRPFPTVEKAYSVLIREEKRRELVLSLEMVAAKVMQNNWLLQNGHSNNNGDNDLLQDVDNNLHEQQAVDQNEVTSIPIEPLLIDLGSPVRC